MPLLIRNPENGPMQPCIDPSFDWGKSSYIICVGAFRNFGDLNKAV
jgi:hypothetical protein